MRMMPAQVAVHLICGHAFPHRHAQTLTERLQEGQQMLVRLTKKDFGYDLQAWHDHLKESREGGYTYGRNVVLPRILAATLASAPWQAAVKALQSE